MRKITTSTLLALLLLAGTAPESRAQQTNAAASLAPQADSTSCMQHEERPQTVNEMRRQRGLTDKHNLFVPRGQWIFGGTASYSTHSNDTYRFLVVEGIESKGYTFKVSPMIAYAFRDNMALGGRFIYSRSLLKLDKADLNLGGEDSDLNFELNDCYSLQQSYSVAMIWRAGWPLKVVPRDQISTSSTAPLWCRWRCCKASQPPSRGMAMTSARSCARRCTRTRSSTS